MILCGLRNATFMTLNENESLPSPERLMRRKPSQFSLFINHMPNQTRQADFYPTIFPTFFHFPRKFRDQKARLSGKEFQTINFYIEDGYVQSMITAKIVLVPILKSSAFDKFPSRTLLAQGLMAGLQPTSYLSITIELRDELSCRSRQSIIASSKQTLQQRLNVSFDILIQVANLKVT